MIYCTFNFRIEDENVSWRETMREKQRVREGDGESKREAASVWQLYK